MGGGTGTPREARDASVRRRKEERSTRGRRRREGEDWKEEEEGRGGEPGQGGGARVPAPRAAGGGAEGAGPGVRGKGGEAKEGEEVCGAARPKAKAGQGRFLPGLSTDPGLRALANLACLGLAKSGARTAERREPPADPPDRKPPPGTREEDDVRGRSPSVRRAAPLPSAGAGTAAAAPVGGRPKAGAAALAAAAGAATSGDASPARPSKTAPPLSSGTAAPAAGALPPPASARLGGAGGSLALGLGAAAAAAAWVGFPDITSAIACIIASAVIPPPRTLVSSGVVLVLSDARAAGGRGVARWMTLLTVVASVGVMLRPPAPRGCMSLDRRRPLWTSLILS